MAARVLILCLLAAELGAQVLHPNFDLETPQLEKLFTNQWESVLPKVLQNPRRFLSLLDKVLQSDAGLWILVDKEHPLPVDYAPTDLVSLDGLSVPVRRSGLSVRALVLPALSSLVQAARREGLNLVVSSAFRSYETQRALFASYARRDGEARANTYSARAGHSQHQLGTTLDFGDVTNAFAETPEGQWLKANAWRFGFSLSYPRGHEARTGYQWESWHWRYIGFEACVLQRDFFDDLQYLMLTWLHEHKDLLRRARRAP